MAYPGLTTYHTRRLRQETNCCNAIRSRSGCGLNSSRLLYPTTERKIYFELLPVLLLLRTACYVVWVYCKNMPRSNETKWWSECCRLAGVNKQHRPTLKAVPQDTLNIYNNITTTITTKIIIILYYNTVFISNILPHMQQLINVIVSEGRRRHLILTFRHGASSI